MKAHKLANPFKVGTNLFYLQSIANTYILYSDSIVIGDYFRKFANDTHYDIGIIDTSMIPTGDYTPISDVYAIQLKDDEFIQDLLTQFLAYLRIDKALALLNTDKSNPTDIKLWHLGSSQTEMPRNLPKALSLHRSYMRVVANLYEITLLQGADNE